MVNIAITGHRPDAFLISHYSQEMVMRIVDNIVAAFKREHKDDLMFNLGGAIGVDQWVGAACIEHKVPFYLYLPFHPDVHSKHWKQEYKDELARQMGHAVGIDMVEPNPEEPYKVWNYNLRNERMVDNAHFVVAFWVGKRRGGTYNAMKYGLKSSKFVFNALDELRPLFKEDLKKGWTPPTCEGTNG